jgi:hypothetical protein
MPTLRVAEATAYTTSTVTLRIAEVGGTGGTTAPKLRVAEAGTTSNTRVTFVPFADITDAEAFDTVTVTAVKTAVSATPDAYAWRQVSGPAALYDDNGGSLSVIVPTVMEATTLEFGVIGYINSAPSSNETTVKILVIPHVLWRAVGGVWVAQTRVVKA